MYAYRAPIGCPCEGNTLGFKFFRAEVQDYYRTSDVDGDTGKFRDETVVISGALIDGTLFAGADTIRIIDKN